MNKFDLYNLLYSPINVLSTLIFLLIVLGLMQLKSNSISLIDKKEARLYRLNVYYKLLLAFVFTIYYLVIFQGGDTYAYWKTMEAMQNLMFTNFDKFWDLVTTAPTMEKFLGYFNYRTGYPMRFIYIEEESFFVTKLFFIFRLITFGSYLATTFIVSFIAANASWKIYELVREFDFLNKKLVIIFVLFLPSVVFWASGISKDTVVLVSIFYLIWCIYNLLRPGLISGGKIKYFLILLFFGFIIYKTRPFILHAMIIPLLLMYVTGLINKIKTFSILRLMIKLVVYTGIIGVFIYSLIYISADELLKSSSSVSEAMVIQQDFSQNTATYGEEEGKRYSLGEIEFSPKGIIKAIPESLLAGIYRPFIWEALRPSLFLNGLESVLFLALSFWFIIKHPRLRMRAIGRNEILIFSVGFVLVIAFMAGFTSILFGVLVRIRAPLLPFFGLLLSIDWRKCQSIEENEKLLL